MKRRRVFVVEDEPIIATGIARKLEQLGYEVAGSATTGDAAVRALVASPPDLVLMDIKLEGPLDGVDVAAEIRKKLDIPVIFLTAYADEATLERATGQDPLAYIVKPFTDRELFGAIEVAMHRHELHLTLREREKRYRKLSEVLSDFAFCISLAVDPENDVLEWSAGSLESVLGVAEDSFRSIEDIFYLISPDDVAAVRDLWGRFREGRSGAMEFRTIREGGRTEWIKVDGRVESSGAGRATLYGALKNITDLRVTERRLEQREFEWSRIVQTMRQGLWVGDADNVCIYANQALCDVSGYSREEIVGNNSLGTLLGGTDELPHELQLRTREGERRTVLVTRRQICDENGTPRGSFSLVVDVTRQRHAMDVVQRSARKLEGVFHASPSPSLLIDAATNAVLDVNEAFTRLTGFDRDAIVGTGGFGLAEYEDLEDLNRMVSLLKERASGPCRIRLRKKDGPPASFAAEVREIVVDDEQLQLLILSPE